MAIYKQVQERMLMPYHYLASNGMEAKHDTPDEELAADALGTPSVAYAELEKRNDRLIYDDGDDADLMTEAEFKKAFYAFDASSVNRMADFGAMKELDRDSAPSEDEHDEVSAPSEPEVNASQAAKKEADKQGVDLRNVEGTGTNGQITVGDVKKAAESNDGVTTWEED